MDILAFRCHAVYEPETYMWFAQSKDVMNTDVYGSNTQFSLNICLKLVWLYSDLAKNQTPLSEIWSPTNSYSNPTDVE